MAAEDKSNPIDPIERESFVAAELIAAHRPRWGSENKRAVYEMACAEGAEHGGRVDYTRWAAMELPARFDAGLVRSARPAPTVRPARPDDGLQIEATGGHYDYARVSDLPSAVEWHVNFADPSLFGYYQSSLFAQDEIQVAEHPVLGALLDGLAERGCSPHTETRGRPTPVLVMGAERRCHVETAAGHDADNPRGLYGNAFGAADIEAIRRATRIINPPTISNIIAIAAPAGGSGEYTSADIESVLVTAYTGFHAAVIESIRCHGPNAEVVVHTGFWGCGAFGGNRVLMPALQMIAAAMAGIDRVVFHTGGGSKAGDGPEKGSGSDAFEAGFDLYRRLAVKAAPVQTSTLIDSLVERGFVWGMGDGN